MAATLMRLVDIALNGNAADMVESPAQESLPNQETGGEQLPVGIGIASSEGRFGVLPADGQRFARSV